MVSYKTSRIIRIAVVILLMAFVIIGSIFAVRALLSNSATPQKDTTEESLLNLDTGRTVKMYVRGKIVAEENFQAYSIEITPQQRRLTVFSGYGNTVKESIVAENTSVAYEQFVYALDRMGFMNGQERGDNRGVCATGQVYEFSMLNNGETLKKLWTSSCSRDGGSMTAKLTPIRKLFLAQIDDGYKFVRDFY